MRTQKKSGFTLIELLVVIAIIAILAAILFPVFARARESARKSTCQNNMKECAIALQLYWSDYDAMLPSSAIPGPGGGTNTAQNFCAMIGELPAPKAGSTGYASYAPTWVQLLYDKMRNKAAMICPSDSVDANTTTASTVGSYWWKYAVDRAWRDLKCQKEGEFGYNADQIILYERAGFHSGNTNGLRNSVQICCAFMDSHVKTLALKDSSNTDLVSSPTSAPTGTFDYSGEPAYFNSCPDYPTLTPSSTDSAHPAPWFNPRIYCDKLAGG